MSKKNVSVPAEKHSNVTVKGVLPPSQLKRFGIAKNIISPYEDEDSFNKEHHSAAKRRWIKKSTERLVSYRLMGACKTETKVPAPMRDAIRYFSRTMTGHGSSGATRRDARPEQVEAPSAS